MLKPFPTTIRIVFVAILAVMLATLTRAIFFTFFNESIPYTPFYPAIVASTMYGRLKGGLIALVLASFAASFWLTPFGRPLIEEPTDLIGMLLFLAVSVLVVALCEGMRPPQEKAEAAAAEREQLLEREQTARREAEEANRLKNEFLASASHELRTPLQAILGWTELLSRADADDQTRSRGLEVIARNARAQCALIEDLLDLGRIVTGKMRLTVSLISPRQPIEAAIQTVAMAAEAKDIEIFPLFDESTCPLMADPHRIQQVVWNLLTNAIKFSPQGSVVKVVLQESDDEVLIQVIDQGCGIEREFVPYVFERFRQGGASKAGRQGGLGLGLAIVKDLVELHGGTVEAESDGVGQGTTVSIRLPRALSAAEVLEV